MENSQVLVDIIFPRSKKIISRGLLLNIILVLSFSFLTALSSKLKIEIGAVPITGQTLLVLLSGILLGSSRGALSQLTYLVFGLLGLPLFARGGGIQYILSPTFGYIIGFVFASFLVGKLAEKGYDKSFKTSILAMVLGNITIYVFGLFWLVRFIPAGSLLKVGLYPFLLGDAIKILIAGFSLPTLWKFIKKIKANSN
ncbi:MAG: biotin transporter BioY [Patescibacteria group bacterium]